MTLQFYNSQNKLSRQTKSKSCFCDSIHKGIQTDTLMEFFCFTKNYNYTLQLKDNYERISRVSTKGSQPWYEELEKYLNDSLKSTNSEYLKIEHEKTNYLFKFVTNFFAESVTVSIDSIGIMIMRDKDTLFSKFFKGRNAIIPENLCENPKNIIVLTSYSTFHKTTKMDYPKNYSDDMSERVPHCDFKDEETTTFPGPPIVPIVASVSYLILHPLDKVLPKVKECVNQGQ